MFSRKLLSIMAITVSLAACGTPSRQTLGTAGGAVLGGAAGHAVTNGSTAGTIGGAALGGVIGNQITK
ncbi:MAG TPA: glycine zipper 2TM domain-containing protein [Noviherbaspirillum sp.]|nr:glycine zipper 2TM domain-containing protein [Noviherbaspirillum sp.]